MGSQVKCTRSDSERRRERRREKGDEEWARKETRETDEMMRTRTRKSQKETTK